MSKSLKKKNFKNIVQNALPKLQNDKSSIDVGNFHRRVKHLEVEGLTNIKLLKAGISNTHLNIKKLLSNTKLTNKQKAEILLVAKMEAYRIVVELIKSMELE